MSPLPLFAIDKLEAFCGGRPEQLDMLCGLIARMIEQMPLDVAKADAAFQAGDLRQAAAALHAAHGAVAPIGAQRFAATARDLEHNLSAEGFQALHAVMDATLEQARQWLAARAACKERGLPPSKGG